MAVKYFCDCCNKENKKLYRVEVYKHIFYTMEDRMNGHVQLVDGNMESFSGVTKSMEFCLPCYNKIMKQFKEILDKEKVNLSDSN